jgi:hypothetical protein
LPFSQLNRSASPCKGDREKTGARRGRWPSLAAALTPTLSGNPSASAASGISSAPGFFRSPFETYLTNNRAFIPNYGERYRQAKTIATSFVESAVNQVVSKRFVKKQQMRWTERGAHLLLQIRTQVLNGDWRATLSRWYVGMAATPQMKAA